jgi:hypothetical protein
MQVSRPEIYAEVRNLGVKAQSGVEWFVPGYTSISQYILVSVYISIPYVWSAHCFFHF